MTEFYLISGYIPDMDKVDLGIFKAIIQKPFTPAQFYEKIGNSLVKDAKVMVVDDETSIGMLACRIAELRGVKTYQFSDPQKALDEYPPLKPDVVLTDYVMPGMTGLEMVTKMKALNGQPEQKE